MSLIDAVNRGAQTCRDMVKSYVDTMSLAGIWITTVKRTHSPVESSAAKFIILIAGIAYPFVLLREKHLCGTL